MMINWRAVRVLTATIIILLVIDYTEAQEFDIEKVKVSETGEEIAVTWCNSTGQDGPDFTHRIELLEFPPKPDPNPLDFFEGTGSQWLYTPHKAGVYYMRARTCHEIDGCSPWLATVEVGDEIPGCVTDPLRIVWYFRLAQPTGGGLDG